jgi:hypothetical protein
MKGVVMIDSLTKDKIESRFGMVGSGFYVVVDCDHTDPPYTGPPVPFVTLKIKLRGTTTECLEDAINETWSNIQEIARRKCGGDDFKEYVLYWRVKPYLTIDDDRLFLRCRVAVV